MSKTPVFVGLLGLCPCGKVIINSTLWFESETVVKQTCPSCQTDIDPAVCFSSGGTDGRNWIGPDGKWTTTRPSVDFELDEYKVFVELRSLRTVY